MEIQSAFNAGVQGFQRATEDANQAAADIVASTSEPIEATSLESQNSQSTQNTQVTQREEIPDLNQSLVDLKVAEHQAKAAAQVIQSADDSLGTLIDVTA